VRRRPVAAWLVPLATLLAWAAAYGFAFRPATGLPVPPVEYVLYGLPYLAFAAVGGLVLRSSSAGPVGWVLALIGLFQGASTALAEAAAALAAHPGSRSAAG
jgi:hypothetical protein